jgi:hypothetical protein
MPWSIFPGFALRTEFLSHFSRENCINRYASIFGFQIFILRVPRLPALSRSRLGDWLAAVMKIDARPSSFKPKLIGILGFDGVSALDLVGPLEAFGAANNCAGNQVQCCYDARIVAVKSRSFVSEMGVIFKAKHTLSGAPNLNTVIVPGGKGARAGETCRRLARWFAVHAIRIKRIAAISSGVCPLAQSGLLDGRKTTTH